MHFVPRRPVKGRHPKFVTLLAIIIILSQSLSIAPRANAESAPNANTATPIAQPTAQSTGQSDQTPVSETGALPDPGTMPNNSEQPYCSVSVVLVANSLGPNTVT